MYCAREAFVLAFVGARRRSYQVPRRRNREKDSPARDVISLTGGSDPWTVGRDPRRFSIHDYPARSRRVLLRPLRR